jgi:hypothetical protein
MRILSERTAAVVDVTVREMFDHVSSRGSWEDAAWDDLRYCGVRGDDTVLTALVKLAHMIRSNGTKPAED